MNENDSKKPRKCGSPPALTSEETVKKSDQSPNAINKKTHSLCVLIFEFLK